MNKALITGGAGFIGTNLALSLGRQGWKVIVLDNLSRKGSPANLRYLKKNIPAKNLEIIKADIRDKDVSGYISSDVVFHLAAQTAVTTSVADPRNDFDINAFGTFNLLEAIRKKSLRPIFIYASTNKVYGALSSVNENPVKGISENTPLDFHSPYGVSKGVGEAYTKDYARIYGLKTVVFRQSCIYGLHQMGIEDQGWVAHLGARAILGQPVNVFGSGRQERDLLYVNDLIDAYMSSIKNISKVAGEVFNIGGGPKNSISVNEYLRYLQKYTGRKLVIKKFKPRPGDQRYFVSDNTKLKNILKWKPTTSIGDGLPLMLKWISDNKMIFKTL